MRKILVVIAILVIIVNAIVILNFCKKQEGDEEYASCKRSKIEFGKLSPALLPSLIKL